MTTVVYCDRCKDLTKMVRSPVRMLAHRIITQVSERIKPQGNIDLCDTCAKSLIQQIFSWWNIHPNK